MNIHNPKSSSLNCFPLVRFSDFLVSNPSLNKWTAFLLPELEHDFLGDSDSTPLDFGRVYTTENKHRCPKWWSFKWISFQTWPFLVPMLHVWGVHDRAAPAAHFWHPDLFHPLEAQRDIRKFLQMDQDWINSRVEIHTVSDYSRFG